jgi:hypothetical protein
MADWAMEEEGAAPVAPPRLSPHRVEYRTGGVVMVLAERDFCVAHHRALDRYRSHLLLSDRTEGEVVLVEPATGLVVARQRVARRTRH